MSSPVIVPVDAAAPDAAVIARAAEVIRRGGLVAMPTETVYGLAGNALSPESIARIYAAKGRPAQNPLIAHVADAAQARSLAAEWPTMAQALAERFWPGPLTLVVRRKATVPAALSAGLDTFGVRVPDHPVALALIRACGLPLAAPSANRFTEVSPVTAAQVARGLGGAVDLILDAGHTRVGIESSVVDVSGGRAVLLRPGSITREELEAVVGPVSRGAAPARADAAQASPGMAARHYAPRARVELLEPAELSARLVGEPASAATGLLLCTLAPELSWTPTMRVSLGADPARYAAGLYDALHEADERRCEVLLIERPPAGPGWDAIHDRLRRAAHPG
ncbi:MAG: threonylcarbamoyl-AMP synthase [Gemmatimonadaceae bacterium]|nr:threonylcarbamoyl-AMP synthase [Gemmatimonadaceae bacterium]MCW5826912.1 threonylcarbamoyl-AMP synthase [Gemmatimonadaceae bacterium]